MSEHQLKTIEKLRELGATRIEVKPDGCVVAEFGDARKGRPAAPHRLDPYLLPDYPWWGISVPSCWPTTYGDSLIGHSASSLTLTYSPCPTCGDDCRGHNAS